MNENARYETPRRNTKLTKVKAEIKKLIDAIKAGVWGKTMRDEMQTLENQRTKIGPKLEEHRSPHLVCT